MVGVVAATALVGGLVGAGTAGASTPSGATKSVQAADSSVRALSTTKPGTKCKAKQKGKTLKTKYGKLKCTKKGKKGKKYVWRKVASPGSGPVTPASCAAYAVGATGPGGGKIFYVDMSRPAGSQCFEAAPDAWNTGVDPTAKWGCSGKNISGAVGLGIGSGEGNTTAIVTACSTTGIAARLAADYAGGSQTDWFLPSKDELNQLCKYARAQSTTVANQTAGCSASGTLQGGFAADLYYWASSQWVDFPSTHALGLIFNNGNTFKGSKNFPLRVRPVRTF